MGEDSGNTSQNESRLQLIEELAQDFSEMDISEIGAIKFITSRLLLAKKVQKEVEIWANQK